MASAQRKRKPTGGFREYCCRDADTLTKGPARRAYVATLVDGILNLLGLAQDKVKQTISFLSTGQTKSHVNAGRPLPKAAVIRIEDAYYKINSAYACFISAGVKDDINDQKAVYGMTLVLDQAQHLYAAVDEDNAFARERNATRYLSMLQRRLDELQDTLLKTHTALIPYAQVATVATLPPAPVITQARVAQRKQELEERTAQHELAPFLEQLRSKGWKTQEQREPEALTPLFGLQEEDYDGFERGAQLIHQVQRPINELLPDDEILGIVKFPVIALNTKHLPESLIHRCTDPRIGYSVYMVFGGYMIVDNMCLLGIHKSLMWVQGENGVELDLDKFQYLMPYIQQHYPQWTESLTLMYPVQPARVISSHCYCPLLPMDVLKSWGNGIGNWEILNS